MRIGLTRVHPPRAMDLVAGGMQLLWAAHVASMTKPLTEIASMGELFVGLPWWARTNPFWWSISATLGIAQIVSGGFQCHDWYRRSMSILSFGFFASFACAIQQADPNATGGTLYLMVGVPAVVVALRKY